MGYRSPRSITMTAWANSTVLSDATAYYFGSYAGLAMQGATTYCRLQIPVTGTIRNCSLYSYFGTTNGSNEAWAFYLANITKGTEALIQTITVSSDIRIWKSDDLGLAVTKGDEVMFKTTTPTWATNPDGMRPYGVFVIEYD